MSMVEEGQALPEMEDRPPTGPSLSDRMAQRSEELSRGRTEWFPVPGYEDMLEVELRPVGLTRVSAIQRKNERTRDPDLQMLYNVADGLVTATVGFREIALDGTKTDIPDSWVDVAQRDRARCPDSPTLRQAILFLLGDERIMFLSEEYTKWVREVRPGLDEEVAEDFARTGSR